MIAKIATTKCDALPALSSPKRVKIHSEPVMMLERRIQAAKKNHDENLIPK